MVFPKKVIKLNVLQIFSFQFGLFLYFLSPSNVINTFSTYADIVKCDILIGVEIIFSTWKINYWRTSPPQNYSHINLKHMSKVFHQAYITVLCFYFMELMRDTLSEYIIPSIKNGYCKGQVRIA